jgi:translocation and assembly module TamA
VHIEGVDGALYKNVEAHLALMREPCDAPEWKIQRLQAQADGEIGKALEVYGHYSATIEKSLSWGDNCWSATFVIDPGPAVVLRQVTVEVRGAAQNDDAFATLLARNPLTTGETLNHVVYENYKKEIDNLARRRGYFDGHFEQNQIRVLQQQLAADVTLIYSSGERYRFGPIVIEQDVVRPDLLERYLEFRPGMPFHAKYVSGLYESLLISGYFDKLDIRTLPRKEPDRDVQITIRGTGAAAQTYTAGLGFGTDTGLKLRAGYSNRRVNKAGHQFEANANASSVISEVGLKYRLPLDKPTAEWLSFDTGYKYEDTDTSRSKSSIFGIKRLKLRSKDWLETQFIDVRYDDFTVADDHGTSFLLIPGLSWTHVASSGPPRPRRGLRINLQVSGTAEQIGSSVAFVQGNVFGKIIRPLWSSARILARAEAGYTLTSNFSDMPASLRYFAGGDVSVRGYDYKNLGPRNISGEVIGGKHLLTGSIELDQRVAQNWSVAAFADGGNAFDDFDAIDTKFSVGAGVRWYSPVGPIRLDVAVPLADDAEDSFRIHITLGPDL